MNFCHNSDTLNSFISKCLMIREILVTFHRNKELQCRTTCRQCTCIKTDQPTQVKLTILTELSRSWVIMCIAHVHAWWQCCGYLIIVENIVYQERLSAYCWLSAVKRATLSQQTAVKRWTVSRLSANSCSLFNNLSWNMILYYQYNACRSMLDWDHNGIF